MKNFIPLTSLLLLACRPLFAQNTAGTPKLKDVQAVSVWAPSNIKIDGALSEWNDNFHAYNKSTKLYYTLANDNKDIYLAIKSTDGITSNKITAGGITVTVNTEDKKKDNNAYSLTFPVIQRPAFAQRPQRPPGGMPGGVVVTNIRMNGTPGSFAGGNDSSMRKAAHERLIASSKEIKISGFKDITDSLVSIYNEYGIKAAIGYNPAGDYIYELAIPLKLLGLSTDSPKEFAYNVKVNGLQIPMRINNGDNGGSAGGGGDAVRGRPGGGFGSPPRGGFGSANASFQEMISPSDFWGKYTLANKQ